MEAWKPTYTDDASHIVLYTRFYHLCLARLFFLVCLYYDLVASAHPPDFYCWIKNEQEFLYRIKKIREMKDKWEKFLYTILYKFYDYIIV